MTNYTIVDKLFLIHHYRINLEFQSKVLYLFVIFLIIFSFDKDTIFFNIYTYMKTNFINFIKDEKTNFAEFVFEYTGTRISNHKPAVEFDEYFGTNLSQKYKFPDNLTD